MSSRMMQPPVRSLPQLPVDTIESISANNSSMTDSQPPNNTARSQSAVLKRISTSDLRSSQENNFRRSQDSNELSESRSKSILTLSIPPIPRKPLPSLPPYSESSPKPPTSQPPTRTQSILSDGPPPNAAPLPPTKKPKQKSRQLTPSPRSPEPLPLESSIINITHSFQFTPQDFVFVNVPEGQFLKASTLEFLCYYILTAEFSNSESSMIQSLVFTFERFSDSNEFLVCLFEAFYCVVQESGEEVASTRFAMFFSALRHSLNHLFIVDRSTGICPFRERIFELTKTFLFETRFPDLNKKIRFSIDQHKPIFQPRTDSVNFKKITIDSTTFAEQITLREWKYFNEIENNELFSFNFSLNSLNDKGGNLWNLITWTNSFCAWIIAEILSERNLSKRVSLLGKMIILADNLLKISNFNGAMEVFSAVNNNSVYRLRQTWDKLKPKSIAAFEHLEEVFASDRNFGNYRKLYAQTPNPKIPFVGFCLSDLTFINDALKDVHVENDRELIHVEKWRKVGKVLSDLLASRSFAHYSFVAAENIVSFNQPSIALNLLTVGFSSVTLFSEEEELLFHDSNFLQMSIALEPKQ